MRLSLRFFAATVEDKFLFKASSSAARFLELDANCSTPFMAPEPILDKAKGDVPPIMPKPAASNAKFLSSPDLAFMA